MKRSILHSRSSQRSGFTLVELLVVMSIIAILASVLFAVGTAAIRAAKRTGAQNTAIQLSGAVTSYYAEYNTYPLAATATGNPVDVYYDLNDVQDWKILTQALSGNINTQPGSSFGTAATGLPAGLNTRGIAYMNPRPGDLDTNGIYKNPFSTTAAPTYFFIAMDADYSNLVGDTGTAAGKIPDFSPTVSTTKTGVVYDLPNGISGGVAVWCNNDQQPTGATNNNPALWSRTW
jgi:prepilin-type N-terminal cleavage/methylation domain-containing protein